MLFRSDEEAFVCFNYPLHLRLLMPRADEKQVRVVPDSLVHPHRNGDALGARVVRALANELRRPAIAKTALYLRDALVYLPKKGLVPSDPLLPQIHVPH